MAGRTPLADQSGKGSGRGMKRYTIIIEKASNNYSAYVPNLPGCITTGDTVDEVVANMQEAIAVHLEAMVDLGIPIPEPTTSPDILPSDGESRLVEVAD